MATTMDDILNVIPPTQEQQEQQHRQAVKAEKELLAYENENAAARAARAAQAAYAQRRRNRATTEQTDTTTEQPATTTEQTSATVTPPTKEQPTTTTQKKAPASTTNTSATEPNFKELQGMIDYLYSEDVDPEKLRKQQKRERARAIINAVGDGLTAISNMYFAAKGGVDTGVVPMGIKRHQEQVERDRKRREDNRKAYLDSYMKLEQLRNTRGLQDLRNRQLEEDALYRAEVLRLRGENNKLQRDKEERIAFFQELNTDIKANKQADDSAYKQRLLDIREKVADDQLSVYEGRAQVEEARAEYYRAKAENERKGKTTEVERTDKYGRTTSEKRTTRPAGQPNVDNAPPSRSGNANTEDNSAPSRRKKK